MKQLLIRSISMLALIAFAVWLFWYTNPEQFELFTAIVMALVAFEWATVTNISFRWRFLFAILFFVLLFVISTYDQYAFYWLYAAAGLVVLLSVSLLFFNTTLIQACYARYGLIRLLGAVIFSASWYVVVFVHQMYGPKVLLVGFLPVWLMDTGAYVFGMWFGKTPFSPTISPKKTWAGFWGGLLSATIITPLVVYYWLHWDWHAVAFLAFIMALASVMGDLFESAVKRVVNVKDSGVLVPGHGGVLDRLDSVLFAMVVYYFLLHYLH